ncbi:hypothetical protein ACQKGD_15190 [Peribacillus frigoritolerans]|uniref:hypothetical protein n=1 Tax=Peribacillus frigoritolerans TaxID=450367 RepID=UPI003D05C1F9
MGFKKDFIDGIKSLHSFDIKKKHAIEDAEELIHNYFSTLDNELDEYFEAAKFNLRFLKTENSYKIQYDDYYLLVGLNGATINVAVRPIGTVYEEILTFSNQEFKFFSRKHKLELSEELLDTYLKDTFEKIITTSSIR